MPSARKPVGRGRREPDRDDQYKESPEAVRLHEAYLEHRMHGGEPPTAKLYLQAAEQFRRLPGAIRSRPGIGTGGDPADEDNPAHESVEEGGEG